MTKINITCSIDAVTLGKYNSITPTGKRSTEVEAMMIEKIKNHEKKNSKKNQSKKTANKLSPPKKGLSLKKLQAKKIKANAQARRRNLKKKVFELLNLDPNTEIKSYYFVKKGAKKVKLTTKNKPNFFINNLLNQATQESNVIEKISKKFGRKLKPKKTKPLKKQFKLSFSPWQRKNIIDKIKEFKVSKAINANTGEEFKIKNNFAAFLVDLTGLLSELASAEGLALFFDFKNKTVTFKKDFEELDEELDEDFD